MKTILFLIPSLAARGAERALVNLVNNLDKSRYRITVQTLFDVGPLRKELSPEVDYCPGLPWLQRGNVAFLKLFTPSFLYKIIVRKRYDIAIAYLEGVPVRILSGCPYSDTKLIAWHHTCFLTAQDFAFCYRSLSEAKVCYQQYDHLVAVSEAVSQSVHQWVGKPCEVIRNVIDEDRIRQLASEPITDIQFPNHPKLFSVGALELAKGYDRLIRAHARLLQGGFPNTLYIIGEGVLKSQLLQLTLHLGVSSSVIFLGHQSNPYRLLRHADLYVCSSYREGLNTAVTEALILGIPVISTECGGARQLLGNDSEYGIIVPNTEHGIYDGLKQMIGNPSMLISCSAQSRVGAHRFEKEEVIAKHYVLFA